MSLRNNIYKMYFLKAVMWFMVSMPIIVLFFQENGLSLIDVMILQGIYSITVALFEIPSGYISDVFGRKNSLILSSILSFVGFLIFSSNETFLLFAIAQFLVGISGSLISGSDSALIYETLILSNEKKIYTKVEGISYAIGNFSEAIAGILGGFLAVSSLYLPVYIQTIVLFFSIPIAYSLVEPPIINRQINDRSFVKVIDILRDNILKNKKLLYLIIFSSVMGLATLSMAWFAQPFFKMIDVPILYFGILWAGLNFTAGFASFNSYKIYNYFNINKIILLVSMLMFLLFITIGINKNILGLIAIFFIYILRGLITPILRNEINKNISSNVRATVLSIRSFIIRISFAIIAPLLALVCENYSLSFSFYILAGIVGGVSFLTFFRLVKTD